ncbi:MAG TPA: response regulator, partial [Pirellulales bacterium]
PYRGSTIIALLLQHRDGEIPSLCAARSDVPPRLDALFKKMLAKSVSRRVQQMSEVVEELEAIADSLAQEEPSSHVAVENAAMTMDSPGGFSLPPEAVGTDSLGFDVTLAPDVAPQLAAPSKSPAGKEASAKPCTVLVVEPSRVQASIIKKYLIEHSLDVVGTAATGKDAVAAVRSLQPRAVVSALHLSDVSGVELAKQIRDEIKVDAPGFVLVTSEADDPDSQSLSRLNRVLMLPKPFTSAQLFEAINLVGGASQPLRPVLGKKASAASSGKKPKSAARVLIVDDSGVARKKIRSVLQQLGFAEFLEATDGAYAIAVAAQEACDLIVTDYNMPLMDGRALVSYLKQNPATSAIPIVMVTTETEPSVLDPVRKLGVLAVIEKAFPAEVVAPLLDPLFAG